MFVKGIGYVFASICLLQLAATNETPETDERIVDGQPTTIDKFPYVMQIWKDGNFSCGGSLLTSLLVATAAHCVEDVKAKQLRVVGGATNLSDIGVSREVDEIIPFSNFSSTTMDEDVVLLKLGSPMLGKHIGVIKLHTGELKPGTLIRVSGWGLTSESSSSPSNQLRTVEVPITEKAICETEYRYFMPVTDNMFCASVPGVKDACAGDSGGPAVINKTLAGIVSYGFGCGRSQYSGVYTDIRKFKDFIEKSLKY